MPWRACCTGQRWFHRFRFLLRPRFREAWEFSSAIIRRGERHNLIQSRPFDMNNGKVSLGLTKIGLLAGALAMALCFAAPLWAQSNARGESFYIVSSVNFQIGRA